MLSVNLIQQVYNGVLGVHILKALSSLALMAGSEDFRTYTNQYILDENVATLTDFKASCLASFQSDFEERKVIRPLVDCIDKAKRQNRRK